MSALAIAWLLCSFSARAQANEEIILWGQGMRAALPAPAGTAWKSKPEVRTGWGAGTHLELIDPASVAKKGLHVFVRTDLFPCDRALRDAVPAKAPSSSRTVAGLELAHYPGAGEGSADLVLGCGPLRLPERRVQLVVAVQIDPSYGDGQSALEALLPAIKRALEDSAPQKAVAITRYPGRVAGNYVEDLPLLGDDHRRMPEIGQLWTSVGSKPGKVKHKQIAPFISTATAEWELVDGSDCKARLATIDGAQPLAVRPPDGFVAGVDDGIYLWLCRRAAGGKLLLVAFSTSLGPARGLAHAEPYLVHVGRAMAGDSEPATEKPGKERVPRPDGYVSFAERIRQSERANERAERDRRAGQKRVAAFEERQRRMREAEREVARLNRKAERKKVTSRPLGGVIFADLSWRVWMDAPSRVPAFVEDPGSTESRSGFGALATAWSGQVGGIRDEVYASANFDLYRGDVRDGATPFLLQLNGGWGRSLKVWSSGGPVEVTTYKAEYLDKYGKKCPDTDSYPTLLDARVDHRSRGCGTKVKVTKTTHVINTSPGWQRAWYAVYGGWRHVSDMLGGDSDDAMRPLNGGGGPVIGGAGFFTGDLFAVEFAHELAYYLYGWDDHGHLGYNGRAGLGFSPIALLDLRWRLDSAVGKEFMFGLRLRLDLFQQ